MDALFRKLQEIYTPRRRYADAYRLIRTCVKSQQWTILEVEARWCPEKIWDAAWQSWWNKTILDEYETGDLIAKHDPDRVTF